MENEILKSYMDLGSLLFLGTVLLVAYLFLGFMFGFEGSRGLEGLNLLFLGFSILLFSGTVFPIYKIKGWKGAWKLGVPLIIMSILIIIWFLGIAEGYW